MNQNYEDKLLGELKQVVAERAAAQPARAPRPGWTPRLVLAGMTTAAMAAGLIVGVPILTGDQAPPAFAVEQNPDGTVTVTLQEFLDAGDELERALHDAGIQADVRVLPEGKVCTGGRLPSQNGDVLVVPRALTRPERVDNAATRFVIDPDQLSKDATLVIDHVTIRGQARTHTSVAVDVVHGKVPACDPVDYPSRGSSR